MNFVKKFSLLLCLLLTTFISVFSQKITPSTIISDILTKKRQNPQMSDRDLADYANEMLAKKGFNYNFEMSELFNKFAAREDFPETMKEYVINFPFEFISADQRKKTFDLEAKKNLMNQCFDQSSPAFPVSQVTPSQATVMIEGKPQTVKIPKEFSPLTASLVDAKTKRKVLQKWVLPNSYGLGDEDFVALSGDGRKLYLAVSDNYFVGENPPEVKELALEISTDGKLQFVPKKSVQKKFKLDYVQNIKIEEDGNILLKLTVGKKVNYLVVPNMSC